MRDKDRVDAPTIGGDREPRTGAPGRELTPDELSSKIMRTFRQAGY